MRRVSGQKLRHLFPFSLLDKVHLSPKGRGLSDVEAGLGTEVEADHISLGLQSSAVGQVQDDFGNPVEDLVSHQGYPVVGK